MINPGILQGIANPQQVNIAGLYQRGVDTKRKRALEDKQIERQDRLDAFDEEKFSEQKKMNDLQSRLAKASLNRSELDSMLTESKVRVAVTDSLINDVKNNPNLQDPAAYRQYIEQSTEGLPDEVREQILRVPVNQLTRVNRRNKRMIDALTINKPKSSFDLVTLVDPDDAENKLSYYKDDRQSVEDKLNQGWTLERGKGQTINIGGKEDSKYAEERLKSQATAITEATKSAESANNKITSLKRFKDASKEGFEGNLAPIMSEVRNFAASFGYSSEKLKDVRFMEQAIGEIQTQFFKEYGARGLTDKDMEIIARSLPRLETDKASRDAIADVLIKYNEKVIDDWEFSMNEEKRIFPELSGKIRQPRWHQQFKEERENRELFESADKIVREGQ